MGLERLAGGIISYEGKEEGGWRVAGFSLTMLEWLLVGEDLNVSQWTKLDYLAALYTWNETEGKDL